MKYFKFFLTIPLVFSFTQLAQAAGYHVDCEAEPVMVECPFNGIHVTGRYLYVQPTGDQMYSDLNKNNKFGDGFFIAAGYHFGNDYDVTANWTFFKEDTFQYVIPSLPSAVIDGAISRERSNDRFHSVNLEFGQTSHWGESVRARFHTDINFTRISRGREFLYDQYQFDQRFTGLGPRVGLDLSYYIGDSGLALVGQGNIVVLVGQAKIDGTQYVLNEDNVLEAVGSINASSRVTTPGFEFRTGLEYEFELSTGFLAIEVGYQWASYLQALLRPNFAQAPALGGAFVGGDQNSFGYNGVYAGLRWQGEWV
jgi:Legionella pneumophila major outer membrane protein precursor